MSLLRLLKAGKSLVGNQDDVGRYRLPSKGLLPKFGGKQNPFRTEASTRESENLPPQGPAEQSLDATPIDNRAEANPVESALAELGKSICVAENEAGDVCGFKVRSLAVSGVAKLEDLGPKDRQRLATAVETECASITRTEEDGVVILRSQESSAPASPFTGASVAKISLRDRAMVWFGQAAASLHKSPPLLFVLCANWGSAAWTGLVIFAKATTPKLKVWWRGAVSKAGAVMKRERKLAKPASPAFPKTSAVQVELSLDRVKVIRNDLTDADLEVVPAKTRVVAASTPWVANAEAKRPEPEWQKVSLEMFRAKKS